MCNMSRRHLTAVLGIVMLGIVVAIGGLIGLMFLFPDLHIGGMTTVNTERNSQTIYKGAEITEILTSRNLIIESDTVDVQILMRKEAQAGEGTIVVEENASGISFNSVQRTHIEWTMLSVDGVAYYKIHVLEPKGLVKRKTATVVYFNLWRDSRVPEGTSTDPYNIVLRTGKSAVTFGGDEVDSTAREMLHIDTLTVESAKTLTLPIPPDNLTSEFTMDIDKLIINGNSITVDARSTIKSLAEINGDKGKYTFGQIDGRLSIIGEKNTVIASAVGGNTLWGREDKTVKEGSLNIAGSTGGLIVWTTDAEIVTGSVLSSVGVDMHTVNGNLTAGRITVGPLKFHATGNANVVATRVGGNVDIDEMGIGTITLSEVRGNVNIASDKLDGGAVTVSFDPELTGTQNPTVTIVGYDGLITVNNIRGITNISVRDPDNGTGHANIIAHFKRVAETVNITANSGYVSGHDTESNITVDMELSVPAAVKFRIIGTSYAMNQNDGTYLTNVTSKDFVLVYYFYANDMTPYQVLPDNYSTNSTMTIKTSTRFYLK